MLTTVIVDTEVLTTVVVSELVVITDVVDAELDIDEDTDVVAIELELELGLVRVVAAVESAVCSGDAKFTDTCKAFSEPRPVV